MNDKIIEYKIKSDDSIKRIVINPKDYFDESELPYTIDSIEKHFLESRNYISEDKEQIVFLNFDISDGNGNKQLTKFTYWGNGLNQIKDYNEFKNGVLSYRTIIQSINLADGNTLTLRVEEIEGQLIPITHSITDIDDNILQKFDLSMFDKSRH